MRRGTRKRALLISLENADLDRGSLRLLAQPMVCIALIDTMVCIGKDWVSKYSICDIIPSGVTDHIDLEVHSEPRDVCRAQHRGGEAVTLPNCPRSSPPRRGSSSRPGERFSRAGGGWSRSRPALARARAGQHILRWEGTRWVSFKKCSGIRRASTITTRWRSWTVGVGPVARWTSCTTLWPSGRSARRSPWGVPGPRPLVPPCRGGRGIDRRGQGRAAGRPPRRTGPELVARGSARAAGRR